MLVKQNPGVIRKHNINIQKDNINIVLQGFDL